MKKLLIILASLSLFLFSACGVSEEVKGPDDDGNVTNDSPKIYNDLLKLENPEENATISSPVKISGEARGNMYFEAIFGIDIEDSNGTVLGSGTATAEGEWMTTDFVPFKAEVTFTNPATSTGFIVLKKENASGLPENDLEIKVPIKF